MGFSVKNKPSPEIIAILFFTSLYLLFPTINNSADALGYSAIPEIGVHHLLYDKLASFCLYSICDNQPEKALHLLQAINGLFAGATLLLASKFLRNSGVSGPIYIWLILIGSTFGWIRFATENETYIIPIFFSMAGMLYWQLFERNNETKYLYVSFFSLHIAVLFHQIHIFWMIAAFLALLFHKNTIKFWYIPIVTGLLIPIVYIITSQISETSFIAFLLGQLEGETVQLIPGKANFIFTPINFIRSFIQIHGIVFLLAEKYWIVNVFMGIAMLSVLIGIATGIKNRINISRIKNTLSALNMLLLMAFIFHFLFAWYSVGNAEFMVMLPLLLILILALRYRIPAIPLGFIGLGICIWNLTVSVIPSHFVNWNQAGENWKRIEKTGGLFISYDQVYFHNYYFHLHPEIKYRKAYEKILDGYLMKSPADFTDENLLNDKIQDALDSGISVYTDCIERPEIKSRKEMANGNKNLEFFRHFTTVKVDSFDNFYGRIYIHRILPKMQVSATNLQVLRSVPFGHRPGGK